MEKLQKNMLSKSFMTQAIVQEKKIKDLEEELQLVRKSIQEKDNLLQQQPPAIPLDLPPTDQSYLDQVPLDKYIPGSSKLEETLTDLGVQDPTDADLAK